MASPISADRVYRASDLNRRGREVLDTARASGARIVDTDGTSMVLVTERVLEQTVGRLESATMLVAAMRAWRELANGDDVTVDALRWVNRLDVDDRATFAEEIARAFDEASRTSDPIPLAVLLREWEVTARQPYDDQVEARLAAGFDPGTYVEIERPADAAS